MMLDLGFSPCRGSTSPSVVLQLCSVKLFKTCIIVELFVVVTFAARHRPPRVSIEPIFYTLASSSI